MANDYFSPGYAAARSVNQNMYHWLTLNVAKAQRLAGRRGIGIFVAPFNAYRVNNSELLVCLLPFFANDNISPSGVTTMDSILTMSIGHYEEVEREYISALRNPIKWFQYGVRFIISLPIQLLNWFGIINEQTVERFTANAVFKIGAGIVALISFVSSVVGLIGGWQPFIDVISKIFPAGK